MLGLLRRGVGEGTGGVVRAGRGGQKRPETSLR